MENRKEEDEVPSKTNLELIHREAKEYKLQTKLSCPLRQRG